MTLWEIGSSYAFGGEDPGTECRGVRRKRAVPHVWGKLYGTALGSSQKGLFPGGAASGFYTAHGGATAGPLVASGTSKGKAEVGVGEETQGPSSHFFLIDFIF